MCKRGLEVFHRSAASALVDVEIELQLFINRPWYLVAQRRTETIQKASNVSWRVARSLTPQGSTSSTGVRKQAKLKPQAEVLRCLTAAFKRPCHKIHKTQEAFSKDLPILEHDCKCEALHVLFIGTLTGVCQNSTRTFRRGLDCKESEHLRHLPGAIQGKLMSHNPLQARLFCSLVKILQIYLKASHFTTAKHVQGNTSTPFSHWRFAFTTYLHRAWVSMSPASGNEQHVAQAFLMDLHLRG